MKTMTVSNYIENCLYTLNDQLSLLMYVNENFSAEKLSEVEVIEEFITVLKKRWKFSIVKWTPTRIEYPDYMFLNGDKGILAYIDFKYVESNDEFSDSILASDASLILKTIRSAESQLDRPIFFVYLLNCRDKKGIYFETSEQIKDRWFKEPCSHVCYTPVFDEMGDFENLVKLWSDLKKNNVRT